MANVSASNSPEPLKNPLSTPLERVLLVLVLLAALAVRIYNLGDAPFWHDEVLNLLKAEYIWEVLRGRQFVSNHPPLLASLLAVWQVLGLAGSEYSTRMVTVLGGVACVAAVYFVTRRLFNTQTALAASLLVAVAPFHVVHARDLKDYILLPLTGTLMAWALFRAAELNTVRSWAVYALLAGLSCYTETFAAPLLAGVNLWFLFQLHGRFNRLAPWILANICGALIFMPYAFIILNRFNQIIVHGQANWLSEPGLIEVLAMAKAMAFGYSATEPWMFIACAMFAVAIIAGFILTLRKDWRVASFMFFWGAAPVALIYIGSHLLTPFFLYRGMLAMTIPGYMLVAYALTSVPNIAVRVIALGSFVAVAVVPLYEMYNDQYTPREFPHRPAVHASTEFDLAAAYIVDNWQDGDVVVGTSTASWMSLAWYGLRDYPHYTVTHNAFVETTLYERQLSTTDLEWVQGYFPRAIQRVAKFKPRVWLVFDDWEQAYLEANAIPIWHWMNAHYTEVDHAVFKGIEVMLYQGDQDGIEPIRTVRRDDDVGGAAELQYAGGLNETYRKVRPDTGLLLRPLDERRGALTLRWADQLDPEAGKSRFDLRVDSSAESIPVNFEISNQALLPRRIRIIGVASDRLVVAPSLYKLDPARDVWAVYDMHNPAPPPQDHTLPVSVSFAFNEDRNVLAGALAPLPTGTYATRTFFLGAPGDTTISNAHCMVTVADQNIFANLDAPAGARWNVLHTGPVNVRDEAAPLDVRITAWRPDGLEKSYANIGWIALRSQSQGAEEKFPYLDTEMTVEPRTAQNWSLALDADVARLDVWVLEYGENGQGYHIFQFFE